MIKGKVFRLTKEEILKKIKEFDIYRFYLGEFTIGKAFCNPIRAEGTPSFKVNVFENSLQHIDYGCDFYRGDCFDLVRQIHGGDFQDVLRIINKDFNLGLDNEPVIADKKIITWERPENLVEKAPPRIQFIPRKFTADELRYWANIRVGEDELKAENIYAPKEVWINRKRVYINDLCFIYHFPGDNSYYSGGSTAIYRPYAEKKKKWFKNVNFNYVEHIDKIDGCNKAFLSKSKKETLLLRNVLETDCIATLQAESLACLSEEALEKFLKVKDRYFVGDSDSPGKSFSWSLTNNYSFKHINTPDKYLQEGIVDFADMAFHPSYGYDKVVEYFKNKNLI